MPSLYEDVTDETSTIVDKSGPTEQLCEGFLDRDAPNQICEPSMTPSPPNSTVDLHSQTRSNREEGSRERAKSHVPANP
jgi:hypothetical protein